MAIPTTACGNGNPTDALCYGNTQLTPVAMVTQLTPCARQHPLTPVVMVTQLMPCAMATPTNALKGL